MAGPADDASAPLLTAAPAPAPAPPKPQRVVSPPPPPPPPQQPQRPLLGVPRILSGLRPARMMRISPRAAAAGQPSMTVRLLAPSPPPLPPPPPPPPLPQPPSPSTLPARESQPSDAGASQGVACVIRRCLAMQNPKAPCPLAEDTVQVIVDFAAASLLELLAIALVDRDFHQAAGRRFSHELHWLSTAAGSSPGARRLTSGGISQLLVPQVAQQFVALPELALSSPGILGEVREEPSCQAFAPFGEDEALLHCQDCSTPILKADDIISSNYRIMTGRAYLTSAAHNITVSQDTHEAHYTTGQYTVRNVSCSKCALKLGITYVGALDDQNHYKIGKFLVGQDLFVRPVCCLSRSRRLPAELPMQLCPRCQRTAVRGALQLVRLMTLGLAVSQTRQLYELLLRQTALESLSEPREKSARRRFWAAPRALLSWCLPLFRKSPTVANYESLARMGLEPSEMIPRLGVDLWQETLQERFGMLVVLQDTIQREHSNSMLASVVRFISAVVRVASSVAPSGANRPERVPMLLQILPALLAPGRANALRGARSLALAVRREWLHCPPSASGAGRSDGSLSSAEVEAVARAITSQTAGQILSHIHSAALSPCSARLELPVEGPPLNPCAWRPPSPLSAAGQQSDLKGGGVELEEEPLSSETTSTSTASTFSTSTDELLLQCLACGNPVLKADDILSSSYRIETGPAFLTSSAYNVQLSAEGREAVYATGHYTVRDATCVRCSARLGIMYTGAADLPNQFKVGKFLMGQDQLILPPPSGSALPKDEQALYRQLLDLLNHGSIIPAAEEASPLSSTTATSAVQGPDAAPAALVPPGLDREQEALVTGGAGDGVTDAQPATMQRLSVTFKRYFRCVFPVVRYVPMVNPWADYARRHSPAGSAIAR